MLTVSKIEESLSLSKPIELYLFEHGQNKFAYTTGSKQYLHTDGQIYRPLPISRSGITQTGDDNKSALKVKLPGDSPVPLLFLTHLPQDHVTLKVFRVNHHLREQFLTSEDIVAESTPSFVSIFSGEVIQSTWDNTTAELTCAPYSALQRRQMLRTGYQAQCNHSVYDELCGLKIGDHQETVTITAIQNQGKTLVIDSKAHPDDYYRAGLATLDGSNYRSVLGVTGLEVHLLSPFDGIKIGDRIDLAKGCDGSSSACHSFGNFSNFLGFLDIPTENPFT
jgi:uncharacterized phage protein (TIGR02218 family)